MRAKITFKTELSTFDLQARLKDQKWWPDFDQDSEQACHIKEAIIEKVAPEHQEQARNGAKFVLHENHRDVSGLVSIEDECYVIRIAGDNISILQRICEEFVHFLIDFCKKNGKAIDLNTEGYIEILETKNRNVVSEGVVLISRKQRIAAAIHQKRVEFTVAVIGLVALIFLLYITFLYRDMNALKNLNIRWAIDIAGKLIGSASITTITAGLNFLFHYNLLRMVNWQYPSEHR